jgi:asparagine synthase (glutamine-hydrolysing)
MSWGRDILNPSDQPISVSDLDALLFQAVASRLEADVPLGCFLSGGVDSALVAAYASRVNPDVSAFTVRMPHAEYDESDAAAATAGRLGIRHQILDCHADPTADLVALVEQLGLPFGDSSLLPTHWVSRAARTALKVALSGDGGDDLFLGYDRHRAIRWLAWLDRLPRESRQVLAETLVQGRSPRSKLDRLARLANASVHNGYKDLVAIFPPPLDAELGLTERGGFGFQAIHHWGMTAAEPVGWEEPRAERDRFRARLALRFDRLFYLPCDLMRKTDTASMAVALEVRAPFLDRSLSKAAINAPIWNLMPGNQRKGLLRQVARKYLPPEIVDRPKQGFAIPIGEWFRSDYGGMKQLLMDHLNSAEPWGPPSLGIDLNMKFVRQMLDEHLGTGPSGRIVRDHSQRLYMLLVLSIWAKWLGSL